MRVVRCLILSLLVLGWVATAPAEQHGELMKEVEAIGDTLSQAMLDNDIDTMLAMYTEDAISLPNFEPRLDGVEAFRQHFEEMSASGMEIHAFESEPTDVWEAGNQVIEIGTFAITVKVPEMPEPIQDQGKYLTVYERDADGALKIKAEIWNTDLNPMEMGGHMEGHMEEHMEEHGHMHEEHGEKP